MATTVHKLQTKSYPYTIDNGAGEELTFLGIVRDSDGERLVGEGRAQPGAGPPMHVHYLDEEALTVKSGKIGYQILGEEPRYAGEGDTVVFAPGMGHRWWNAGTTELRTTGWAKPTHNNYEYILATLFESRKRNGGKLPTLFDIAFLATRYRSEWAMLAIPTLVQRILFPVIVTLGRILGKYVRFEAAPEPVKS